MQDPAVSYLSKSLINYAMSDALQPKAEATKEQLYAALR